MFQFHDKTNPEFQASIVPTYWHPAPGRRASPNAGRYVSIKKSPSNWCAGLSGTLFWTETVRSCTGNAREHTNYCASLYLTSLVLNQTPWWFLSSYLAGGFKSFIILLLLMPHIRVFAGIKAKVWISAKSIPRTTIRQPVSAVIICSPSLWHMQVIRNNIQKEMFRDHNDLCANPSLVK